MGNIVVKTLDNPYQKSVCWVWASWRKTGQWERPKLAINMDWKEHWENKRRVNSSRKDCAIWINRTRIHVACPFSLVFKKFAIEMGAVWRRRSVVWVFKLPQLGIVERFCQDLFPKVSIYDTRKIEPPQKETHDPLP